MPSEACLPSMHCVARKIAKHIWIIIWGETCELLKTENCFPIRRGAKKVVRNARSYAWHVLKDTILPSETTTGTSNLMELSLSRELMTDCIACDWRTCYGGEDVNAIEEGASLMLAKLNAR